MIEVSALPLLSTVQDLGRRGYWAQGLGTAGVMDGFSHRIANWLLGNEDNDATLEIPLTPARFEVVEDTALALCGAACAASIDGLPLPRFWAGTLKAGQTLTLGAMREGARVYLAMPGGIDVPEVLASRSTQLREGVGGFHGRVLKPGDRLSGRDPARRCSANLSFAGPRPPRDDAGAITLRVIASSETAQFDQASQDALFAEPYRITAQSNRQGYRLEGPELRRVADGELRSHGIAPGVVQVPSGGQPIIQLSDAATMGGYPKIACVIEADLWRIGQARPGDRLRFVPVEFSQMRRAEADFADELMKARHAIAQARTLQRSWS